MAAGIKSAPSPGGNTRKLDDGERLSKAIRQVHGKRLEYRESADNPSYAPAGLGQMDTPFEAE
jgi:hypothetical protein